MIEFEGLVGIAQEDIVYHGKELIARHIAFAGGYGVPVSLRLSSSVDDDSLVSHLIATGV